MAQAKTGDTVHVNYTGKLRSGKTFDEGKGVPLPLEGMIPGFTEGLMQMKKGGKYKLTIPAEKAYGAEEKKDPRTGEVVLPANSDLIFDIEVIDADPRRVKRLRFRRAADAPAATQAEEPSARVRKA